MNRLANFLVASVAAIQAGIALVEMFAWRHLGVFREVFDIHERLGLTSDAAKQAADIVSNAGLYNGFLAAGLVWTLIDRSGTRRAQVFFLACVVVAGLFGAATLDWPTLVLQALPAAAALTAVSRTRPIPHRELDREYPPPYEDQDIDDVIRLSNETLRLGQKPVLRGQHAKATGAVRARFEVDEGRPPETRFGVFREARPFDAIVRFSNGMGRIRPDTEKDARGMAIKLLGVEGPRALEEVSDSSTQDFVMINFPVFAFRDARQYAMFTRLKRIFMGLIGPNGNQVAQVVFFIPWHLRQFWNIGRKIKGVSESVLTETYWSMSPYRLGPRAVKFLVEPQKMNFSSPPARSGDGQRPADFLTRALGEHLRTHEARFNIFVQFQTDADAMPVEDATVVWSKRDSEPVKVATLVIEKGPASSAEDDDFPVSVDAMSFNPWHTLPDHHPNGGINRLRKSVYQANARIRGE